MANAMSKRITAQFGDLFTQAKAIQAKLDALAAAQAPAAPDAILIDELPYAAANLASAPPQVKTGLVQRLRRIGLLPPAHKAGHHRPHRRRPT
jgi:hypothetical protein